MALYKGIGFRYSMFQNSVCQGWYYFNLCRGCSECQEKRNDKFLFLRKIRYIFFSKDLNMVLAPCMLKQIRETVMWQFAVIGRLPYFCRKRGVYVLI